MPTVSTAPTPNPNSLKFTIAGVRFIESGLKAYNAAHETEGDPLGAALFSLDGVANVFIVPEFITVTKQPAASWNRLVEAIEGVLRQHVAGE